MALMWRTTQGRFEVRKICTKEDVENIASYQGYYQLGITDRDYRKVKLIGIM